jgi:hypothetical protein
MTEGKIGAKTETSSVAPLAVKVPCLSLPKDGVKLMANRLLTRHFIGREVVLNSKNIFCRRSSFDDSIYGAYLAALSTARTKDLTLDTAKWLPLPLGTSSQLDSRVQEPGLSYA